MKNLITFLFVCLCMGKTAFAGNIIYLVGEEERITLIKYIQTEIIKNENIELAKQGKKKDVEILRYRNNGYTYNKETQQIREVKGGTWSKMVVAGKTTMVQLSNTMLAKGQRLMRWIESTKQDPTSNISKQRLNDSIRVLRDLTLCYQQDLAVKAVVAAVPVTDLNPQVRKTAKAKTTTVPHGVSAPPQKTQEEMKKTPCEDVVSSWMAIQNRYDQKLITRRVAKQQFKNLQIQNPECLLGFKPKWRNAGLKIGAAIVAVGAAVWAIVSQNTQQTQAGTPASVPHLNTSDVPHHNTNSGSDVPHKNTN